MRSTLLHNIQDAQGNQWKPPTAEHESEMTALSQRVPLYARAPTRIDLAGGWTDLIPFARENEGGVVNAAIDLHVYVSLTPVPDSCVSLYAVDIKEFFHPVGVSTSLHGLNLPQAVLSRFRPDRGCHLVTWSEVPKGSGLGASGAWESLLRVCSRFSRKRDCCNTKLLTVPPSLNRKQEFRVGNRITTPAYSVG